MQAKYYFPSPELDEQLKHIRLRVRALMNGVTADAMIQSGILYKRNFGVSLVHLKEMSKTIVPVVGLHDRLWKSEVREYMILALLIPQQTPFSIANLIEWLPFVNTYEIVEIAAMVLFCNVEGIDAWIEKTLEIEEGETSYSLITALLVSSRLKQANTHLVQCILQRKYSQDYFVQQSLARALCAQGRKDASLAKMISSWASTNQHLSDYCREELNCI